VVLAGGNCRQITNSISARSATIKGTPCQRARRGHNLFHEFRQPVLCRVIAGKDHPGLGEAGAQVIEGDFQQGSIAGIGERVKIGQ
jgi:hypothetical protein